MPQADRVITLQLAAGPTGFLADLSHRAEQGIVEATLIRLHQASAMLTLVKNDDVHVPLIVQNALGGIETMIDDAHALLSTVEGRA